MVQHILASRSPNNSTTTTSIKPGELGGDLAWPPIYVVHLCEIFLVLLQPASHVPGLTERSLKKKCPGQPAVWPERPRLLQRFAAAMDGQIFPTPLFRKRNFPWTPRRKKRRALIVVPDHFKAKQTLMVWLPSLAYTAITVSFCYPDCGRLLPGHPLHIWGCAYDERLHNNFVDAHPVAHWANKISEMVHFE